MYGQRQRGTVGRYRRVLYEKTVGFRRREGYRRIQTGINGYRRAQIGTGGYKQVQEGTRV